VSFASQEYSCLLETTLLLILQRAHARYLAKPLMKTGGAHACLPCEAIDANRLAKMRPEPHDGRGNPLWWALCLGHSVQHRTAVFEQKAEQNLTLDHRSKHGDLNWVSQQADQAQECI